MYREFVGPIRELKAGAERIKEGNLDNDVVINSGGEEIRELCNAFNEMRAELKDSIDARIVYEKQNRDLISNISHDLEDADHSDQRICRRDHGWCSRYT